MPLGAMVVSPLLFRGIEEGGARICDMTAIERQLDSWRAQGIDLLPPADEATIRGAFARLGAPCSAEVVRLYQLTGGMDGGMDEKCFSLWPLARIGEWNGREPRGGDIAFADWLINSHLFFLRHEDDDHSSVHRRYEEPRKLADSVEEFFERCMNDPESVDVFVLSDYGGASNHPGFWEMTKRFLRSLR
jgi:hypothetical protein